VSPLSKLSSLLDSGCMSKQFGRHVKTHHVLSDFPTCLSPFSKIFAWPVAEATGAAHASPAAATKLVTRLVVSGLGGRPIRALILRSDIVP
jgi:hypothetical protein